MSREKWISLLNRRCKQQNLQLVKTKAHDPRWPQLGDYYAVDTKTKAVVLRHLSFEDFGPKHGQRLRQIEQRRRIGK